MRTSLFRSSALAGVPHLLGRLWRSKAKSRKRARRRSCLGVESLESRALLSPVVQAAFYVSPGGSDNNPGTIKRPFRTLSHARNAVRKIDAHMTGDIDVILCGGTYNLARTLTLDQRNSGTNGYQVVWEAYPGEQPVVSGGEAIRGWTLHNAAKNIWEAPVGSLQTSPTVRRRRAPFWPALPADCPAP